MPLRRELGFCWIWKAALNADGYGKLQQHLAHRLTYIELHGAIPEGLQMDHLCRVRSCCNPAHLEPVTPAENTRRGDAARANRERFAQMTHCRRGHEFTAENTRVSNGSRTCRACGRTSARLVRGLSPSEAADTAVRPPPRLMGSRNAMAKISDDDWQEALRRIDAGESQRAVARMLGVTAATVRSRLLRRYGPPPAHIRARRAVVQRESYERKKNSFDGLNPADAR